MTDNLVNPETSKNSPTQASNNFLRSLESAAAETFSDPDMRQAYVYLMVGQTREGITRGVVAAGKKLFTKKKT